MQHVCTRQEKKRPPATHAIGQVDFEDTVHPRQANYHSVFYRQSAPAQARARTARHEWNVLAMANPQDLLDLLRRPGQEHGLRNHTEIRQPVTLIGFQFFLRCDQATVPRDGAELLEDTDVHEYSVWPAASGGAGSQKKSLVPLLANVKPIRALK